MKVDSLMLDAGPQIYYQPAFRNVLEDHMSYLRNHPSTSLLTVEAARAYKFEFDLFSLLNSYSVPPQYHWLIMRMNKMVRPTEATQSLENLYIPDFNVVERIHLSYRTTRKIT